MRKFVFYVSIVNCLRDRLRNIGMASGCPKLRSVFILINLHIIRYNTRTNLQVLHVICILFLLGVDRRCACVTVLRSCKGSNAISVTGNFQVPEFALSACLFIINMF
jgi:hypothetical protein